MKRLKVLTNRAHCGHQYELWKLPIKVYIIEGVGDKCSGWSYDMRPLPKNAQYINAKDIDLKDFDLAIAHFDENFISPRHPVLDDSWGTTFKFIIERYSRKIPTIAVCHGAPQFKEQGRIEIATENITIYEDRKQQTIDYLKNVPVICNSYDAEKLWGFENSTTIWHGFDPNEFTLGTRTKGILAMKKDALLARPHCRGFYTHNAIMRYLPKKYIPVYTTVDSPYYLKDDQQKFAKEKFTRYINNIGEYSIYLNTTVHSPMPRSRGEAMMCGLVSVNYTSHDVDQLIEDGVDGFYSKDPQELAEIVTYLMRNPEITLKLGLKSREKAIKMLHIDRYLKQWTEKIKETL